MQVRIEDVSPVEKKLAVEIPWEHVRDKLDAAYKELGKGVTLKGFRKGKVPRSVLERLYGRQVQLEVAKELVQESFLAAAREHSIEPVAEPVVENAAIRPGEAFRYSARIEIRGAVELAAWEALPVTRKRLVVTDEQVGHALEHKRLMHTEYKAIEGRAETRESDVLVVAAKGKVGELPVDRPELTVDLGHVDLEPLPGLARALRGLPLDTRDREIVLDIPADAPQKEIAGQKATLRITIKEAREKLVPALDDELAKDTGEADSLADLTVKTRADLEKQGRAAIDREVREAALKELVRKNPIPIAPALVERGIDSQIHRARMSLAMQGIDMERAGIDMTAMREKLRDSAGDEVRGQLLLEALADQQKLEVAEAEVLARIAELAAARDKTAQKLRAEMDRDGSLESLKWRMRQEKALDLVVARATISEEDKQND